MTRQSFVLQARHPAAYLRGDPVVQTDDRAVISLAHDLRRSASDDIELARAAFHWVRDEVGHSYDVQDPRVTLTAGEVLRERVGLCYAKSHLLAALLRVAGIPTGLCYQRLAHADGHVLHGLVAVYLGGGWHRQDPRGNKEGVTAEFSLTDERLAWRVDPPVGEVDYPQLMVSPAASQLVTVLSCWVTTLASNSGSIVSSANSI
ncbi:transglutaminase family protein [Nocardia zapadnayensis]|uniref:transglutaminase-like domain-containing protein n=1 Tax=Nocardia rhamnosiphila TaxID=426716 RepID=UPI002245DF6D|nr:transglutaminase family protein [Nocardia zapadnayensis]MCX0274819.1 transglutaminase family protein [Nocardia zapadnayensis]